MVESKKRSEITQSAALQRRFDYFAHELAATCLEEQQFRFRRHRKSVRRELKKLANAFTDRRAARLPRDQVWNPRLLEGEPPAFALAWIFRSPPILRT